MNVAILRSSTLQKAISVHDFKEQVKEMYSPDDPDKLVRLQFVPVHKINLHPSTPAFWR